MSETARALEALNAIPPDLPRDEWVKVGMGAHAAGLNFDTFDAWSAGAANYNAAASRDVWRSIKPGKGVGAGTLYRKATENGWSEGKGMPRRQAAPAPRPPEKQTRKPAPGKAPADVWSRCEQATSAHAYVNAKGAVGVPLDGLRVLPSGDPLRIAGERMAGALVVPAYGPAGELQSLQLIPPPDAGKKMNLPGAPMAGASFTVGNVEPGGVVHVCEGIGAAWACWQATGAAAVVCFGWGNVARVAADFRARDASARLVLVPDVGKEAAAAKIAADVGAAVALMPQSEANNFDANDLAQRDGPDVLATLLDAAKPPPLPLGVVFADELATDYEPPDELVQGILTAEAGSMLYGDSNSGKTFFTIDLACAVARGTPWMGRKTEPGLVVYVAAESPASVRSRLQAYQLHHQCRVPNFAIVQTPLDLFSSDKDTDALIALVKLVERQRGQKARLIVGDTLARLSAGANENSGEDMGLVVQRFDRIRAECGAHFLMIHHSGKAAANGARGWSGIRAAMDTEIEVTDGGANRCAEVTKQRDLSTKGERIGFTLERVYLGLTKWGAPATTCIVLPADAPEKATKGKRMGEVEGAVSEFLKQRKVGVRKAEVTKHFESRYERSNVYRAIRSLVAAHAIHEAAGMVCIAEGAK